MKLYKCIISGFLAIAITVSLTIPAFAIDPGTIVGGLQVAPDFGSWVWSGLNTGYNLIGSLFDDDICPGSSEYNNRHDFVPMHTQVNGKTGLFYVCSLCGKSAGEVLTPAYDEYVETLPATGYDSSGGLFWSPVHNYFRLNHYAGYAETNIYCEHYDGSHGPHNKYSFSFNCASNTCSVFPASGSASFSGVSLYVTYKGIAPIDGFYSIIQGESGTGYYIDFDGVRQPFEGQWTAGSSVYYSTGASISAGTDGPVFRGSSRGAKSFFYQGIPPVYKIIPSAALSADTYNINTRPTSITGGNYGIVGDNGQITKVEDNSTIINETNNTYYNPATGQTVPITNWSYDYSDRSYKVILESGDTATITYGDENITIQEGDTVYNVYYLIDGSGSGEVCAHEWTETSTTPATCTMPGSKLSTCSKCQQTKTETIPALGHDWQVKQSVTTEYDDTGQLVQEGYTIYECSRCHEQYKAASGTSPPVNPSDPDASGDGVFSGIFGLLLDFLGFFFKTFKDFTKSGVKAFLDALKDGTSDIFGLLNPFDWSA